jgi:hypothetical protein
MRRSVPTALLLFVGGLLTAACGEPEGDGAQAATESAFTVDHGDRFVVSATPERIVLAKKVGGVAFPFDEESLLGKAILIHPVDRRAVNGVYARALSVASEGDRYVIQGEPLTLAEMETIAEDDIVRIFIDPKTSRASRPEEGEPLSPATLRPRALTANVGFNGLDVGGFAGLDNASLLKPGVTFSHHIEKVSVTPEMLVDWTSEKGLELGARGTFEWKSKVTIGGHAGAEFFRSMTVESPPYIIAVPIGAVPVPVTLSASAVVSCSAGADAPLALAVTIAFEAKVGGSFYVHPTSYSSPASWMSAGSWEPELSGSGSVTPELEDTSGVTVQCAAPHIELKAMVAGVAGVYLALTPNVTIAGPSPGVEAVLAAGVRGKLFGRDVGKEITLLSWKP